MAAIIRSARHCCHGRKTRTSGVIHLAAGHYLARWAPSDSKQEMQNNSHFPHPSGDPVPFILRDWLQPLRACFTAPSWEHVLVLVMGALLAPGKRTVSACLRI